MVVEVVGVVSLTLQVFHGCIKAYALCQTARNLDRDGDLLSAKLSVQQALLEEWAEWSGILSHTPDKPAAYWDAIRTILEKQTELLLGAFELREQYALNSGAQQVAPRARPGRQLDMSRVRSLFDKLQRRSSNEGASSPQQAHSVWQRASWAVTDKQKMEQLVKEIQSLNNQLFKFLQHQAVVDIQKTQDMMSRALVFLCNNNAELKNVEDLLSTSTTATSVKEAALVKKWRLMLKTDLQNNESALQRASTGLADADIRYFSFQKLTSAISQEKQGVCVAEYNDWTVFVEWRTIPNNWDAMKASLKRLAKLIQVANDPAFHALPCEGYVEHVETGRFGFVSNITHLTTSTPTVSFKTASLNDLIKQCGWAPLATRMRIAHEMAEAVLQLHTVGWLHKSIHSGNIRFVIPDRGQANKIALEKPYLVGYGYARPDTESGAALTENADWTEEVDFYQHPDYRGKTRKPFCRTFDMYGLASLLIELALWECLETILGRYRHIIGADVKASSTSLVHLFADTDFQDELLHHVEPSYADAVRKCLDYSEDYIIGESSVLDSLESTLSRRVPLV